MTTATNYFTRDRHIAPLAVFRIAFGAVLFFSTCRFIIRGWVHDFYIAPKFHFPFFGFEWVHSFGAPFMYTLYGMMAVSALCICTGLFYRVVAPLFFLCFCYAELLDKTYYLNHYYLVTICSFLLIWTPANRYCSLDVLRRPALRVTRVPSWTILMFKYQLCIIYCCAGLSKLTGDWLLRAMPLKIWLPAKASLPVIGPLLQYEWMAYFFSWASALFDLSIPFILLNKSTRRLGYFLVIIFHVLSAILFQIGMFPWLMMSATLIFFSENFHITLIGRVRKLFSLPAASGSVQEDYPVNQKTQKLQLWLLGIYFLLQVLIPFRYLLYPGTLLWTEEGYRFSWRVMLMEKGGTSFFYVKSGATGKKFEINNADFLTPYQERMMETQPDMILQYAKILKNYYQEKGMADPEIIVESYVTLNGSGSRLFIDSTVNLANEKETWFGHKSWILPFINK
jgi:Vitamin K-dependent gamma-carboxylase